MTSPMPRDSLGRIVYAGDVLACGATVERILPSGGIGVVFPNGGVSGFSSCYETIDLAASPKRTNHERYLADLATCEDVLRVVMEQCDTRTGSCGTCPFDHWGDLFDVPGRSYCTSFGDWLDERAVI